MAKRQTSLSSASLSIAKDGTDSDVLTIPPELTALAIHGPSALTGTVTVKVSLDGTNYDPLYVSGSDVTITANKVLTIDIAGFKKLQLISGASEGSARTFYIAGTVDLE